jgi:acetoin utilization deacetylase AcuC-like enzyme
MLLDIARDHADGRCAAILEGGYDLTAIRNSASAVLTELQGERDPLAVPAAPSRAGGLIERIRKVQSRYWAL